MRTIAFLGSKKTLASIVLTGAMALGLAGKAKADDISPPAWRGQPLTTKSVWEFNSQPPINWTDNPADSYTSIGDGIHSLYSSEGAHAFFNPSYFEWDTGKMHNTSGGTATVPFYIVNFVDDMLEKDLRIQFQYSNSAPLVNNLIGWEDGGVPGWEDDTPYSGTKTGEGNQGNTLRYEDWQVEPNPDYEYVYFMVPADTYLDQVVIDTISTDTTPTVPEPSTMALVGTGLLSLIGAGFRSRMKK